MSTVLYDKQNVSNNQDIWDDSILIKAYNESLKLGKEEVAKSIARSTNGKRSLGFTHNSESESSSSEKPRSSAADARSLFKVGDFVRCVYEDGVDYEAEIKQIDVGTNSCLLKYIGYGNEQIVNTADLLPSWGKKARKQQMLAANAEKTADTIKSSSKANKKIRRSGKDFNRLFSHANLPQIPPLPPTLENLSEDSECLSAMLMSWYMTGYYTGIYQGRKQAQMAMSRNKK